MFGTGFLRLFRQKVRTSKRRAHYPPRRRSRLALQALENRRVLSAAPIGAEFQVNTFDQLQQREPSVAMAPDSSSVVVWFDYSPNAARIGIYGQRYDDAGAPLGGEFQVSTTPLASPLAILQNPDVAFGGDGSFVVAWSALGSDDHGWGVRARRFDSTGAPLGNDFAVNTYTTSTQWNPTVAVDGDGDFVVAWESHLQDRSSFFGIYAQRFNAQGVRQGPEFRVHTSSAEHKRPAAAMNAAGDLIIAWDSQGRGHTGLFAQAYDPSGAPEGSEFRINQTSLVNPLFPSVSMDEEGDFVIVWQQDGPVAGWNIYARQYGFSDADQDGDGEFLPRGNQFQINTVPTTILAEPVVASKADGDFIVAWRREEIFARAFSANAQPLGDEFQVNTHTVEQQITPTVAMDENGDALIAWESAYQTASQRDIFAQRYVWDDDAVMAEAIPLPLGDEARGTISRLADVDMYAITALAGQMLFMDIDLPSSSLDSYLRLFDAAGNPLAASDNGSGHGAEFSTLESALQYTFPVTGTYYIGVSSSANSGYSAAGGTGNVDGHTLGEYSLTATIDSGTPALQIMDDNEPGFFTTGLWSQGNGVGHNQTFLLGAEVPGAPNSVATWAFNVMPGRYRVSTGWVIDALQTDQYSAAAPFSVTDLSANVVRGTTFINQQTVPDDFAANGSVWEDIGVYDITGPSLIVQLKSVPQGVKPNYVVADVVRIERLGDLPATGEVQVTESGVDIADGAGSVSFGSQPGDKTFVISNSGMQSVTLSGAVTVTPGSGFAIVEQPGVVTLSPGQSTTFRVRLQAGPPGAKTATVSFASSDSDEGAFDFTVTGTLAGSQIIDDSYTSPPEGAPGFRKTGAADAWGYLSGSLGRDFDMHYTYPAYTLDQSHYATWTFHVAPGKYRVAATWQDGLGTYYANNAPFTVLDEAAPRGAVALNQEVGPNDFSAAASTWEYLGGEYDVASGTLVVKATVKGAEGFVTMDAVRIEWVGDLPAGPEANLSVGDTNIIDGAGIVDFGTTQLSSPVVKTFTISNSGAEPLTIGAVSSMPPGFTLVQGPGVSTLASGESTTFTVRLDASRPSRGSLDWGVISFATNDPSESTFNFSVQGAVLSSAIIDNEQPGVSFNTPGFYSQSSDLAHFRGFMHGGDFAMAQSHRWSSYIADWSFTVEPGQYRVAATWVESPYWAVDAPYTVIDGGVFGTRLATVTLDQRAQPWSFTAAGSNWQDFGQVFNITGNRLTVRLEAYPVSSGYVIFDAIRIERIGDLPVGNAETGPTSDLVLPPSDDVTLRPEAVESLDAAALHPISWNDDLEASATLLAEDPTRPDTTDDVATRQLKESEDELHPSVVDWT